MPVPQIPVGLATKAGLIASSLAAIFALVAAILEGDHSTETIGALIAAAAPLYAVIKGRMDQATATIATATAPAALGEPVAIDEPGNDAMLAEHGVLPEDLPPA